MGQACAGWRGRRQRAAMDEGGRSRAGVWAATGGGRVGVG